MSRLPRAAQLKLQASRREASYRSRVRTRPPRSESYHPVSFIQILPPSPRRPALPRRSSAEQAIVVLDAPLVFCLLTSRACIPAGPQCNGPRARRSLSPLVASSLSNVSDTYLCDRSCLSSFDVTGPCMAASRMSLGIPRWLSLHSPGVTMSSITRFPHIALLSYNHRRAALTSVPANRTDAMFQ